MERFALLIDLGAERIGANMFRRLYDDLKQKGSIEYLKFYNYNTKRHREFRSIVSEYGAKVELPECGKKRVRIDMRQVIDGVRLASTCSNITAFFLIAGKVDSLYLMNELKRAGKLIIVGVTSPSSLSDNAHYTYILDRSEEVKDEEVGEEVAVASCETLDIKVASQPTRVKGDKTNVFPYSDIDSADIDEKMKDIDRRIIEMIDSRHMAPNITSIFGDDIIS